VVVAGEAPAAPVAGVQVVDGDPVAHRHGADALPQLGDHTRDLDLPRPRSRTVDLLDREGLPDTVEADSTHATASLHRHDPDGFDRSAAPAARSAHSGGLPRPAARTPPPGAGGPVADPVLRSGCTWHGVSPTGD